MFVDYFKASFVCTGATAALFLHLFVILWFYLIDMSIKNTLRVMVIRLSASYELGVNILPRFIDCLQE